MIIIRPAQTEDSSAISIIYNEYIANTVVTFEEELITATDIELRISQITSDNLPWLVAVDESDNVLGYAYASKWHGRFSYRFSVEVTVYLSPSHTSKGLGTKLYDELFTELKRNKIHCIIGCITLPNEASIALHEKFSMEKVAHFKEVGLKFDRWLDVGYWQTILS